MKSASQPFNSISNPQADSESPFIPMTPFHRILTVGILAVCLVWIGVQQWIYPSPAGTMGWVFLALAGNFLVMLVPIFFYRSSYGWFHPLIFGIFLTLITHLRRVDTYIYGLQYHTALPGWDADRLTLLIAYELVLRAVSLIACYFGFFLIPSLGVPKIQFGQPRNLGFKMFLVVLFSAGVFAVFIQSRGGLSSHILSWEEGRSSALEGTAYWLAGIQFGVNACLVWLAMDRKATRQPLFWGCTVLSLAMMFLSGGSRSSVIYPMVMGLLVWLLRERKIALGRLTLFALTGILLIGLLGNFRASTYEGRINWDALTGAAPTSTTDDSAFTSGLTELTARGSVVAGVFPILALVPEKVDFIHGSSYLALLTLPVPRAIWPEKPGMVDGRVGEAFYGVTYGIPPGPIGEAYWNFGIPGILLVFFLLGAFYKWLSEWFQQYAQQPTVLVLYIITLFQLAELSSSAILDWLLGLVPFLIILRLIGAIAFRRTNHENQERSQTV